MGGKNAKPLSPELQSKVKEAFQKFDVDGSNEIDKQEALK